SFVSCAFIQEVKGDLQVSRIFICNASQIPVITVYIFSYCSNIISYCPIKHFGVLPVNRYVLQKLEFRFSYIILRKIGQHLDRRVNGNQQGQLLGSGGVHSSAGIALANLHIKNSGGEIHWSCKEPGKWKNGHVIWWVPFTPGVIFNSAGSLPGHHIGICSSFPGVLNWLVKQNSKFMLSCFFQNVSKIFHPKLPVVPFLHVEHGTYMTNFYVTYSHPVI